jgi:hypothetical protein
MTQQQSAILSIQTLNPRLYEQKFEVLPQDDPLLKL